MMREGALGAAGCEALLGGGEVGGGHLGALGVGEVCVVKGLVVGDGGVVGSVMMGMEHGPRFGRDGWGGHV
jgi:hypothetical protein